MPTPEEQRQYSRLSGELQRLGHAFRALLPAGTASLHLHPNGQLDTFDGAGKMTARLPTDHTPKLFREAIERLSKEKCPDPDGIVCPL
ncbi:MAG: hypothetical protein WAL34_04165 [Acidobacteriaceae bacterium]